MGCLEVLTYNQCLIAYISVIPPISLLLLLMPISIVIWRRIKQPKDPIQNDVSEKAAKNSKMTGSNLWGHELHWLLFTTIMFVYVLQLLESCWSAARYHTLTANSFIYVFAICDICHIFGMLCILFVYTYIIESRKQFRILWILFIYWMLMVGTDTMKLLMLNFKQNQQIYSATSVVIVLTVISLLLHFVICILDFYIMASKKYTGKVASLTSREPEYIKFVYPFVTLPSKVSFHWMNGLLRKGYKTPLQIEDLGTLPYEECSEENFRKFKTVFEQEQIRAKKKNIEPSLWRCYAKAFWPGMLLAFICHLIGGNAMFIGPMLLPTMVDYVMKTSERREEVLSSNDTSRTWFFEDVNKELNNTTQGTSYFISSIEFFTNGYVLAVFMCVASLIEGYANQTFLFLANREGTRLKAAIQAMVFDKTLKLPSQFATDSEMSQGQILNHMSIDAMNLFTFFSLGLMAIGIPIQVFVGCMCMYQLLGVSALLTALVILCSCPLQYFIGKRMATIQKQVMDNTDERIKKVNETLQSIKLLKLYAWEGIFCKSILKTRHKELKLLLKVGLHRAFSLCVTDGIPMIAGILLFSMYPFIEGKALSPGNVFASYSIILLINYCLFLLPTVMNAVAHAVVSTKRLQKFFITGEIEPTSRYLRDISEDKDNSCLKQNPSYNYKPKGESDKENINGNIDENVPLNNILTDEATEHISCLFDEHTVVMVKDGSFSWNNSNGDNLIVKDLNLLINEGSLTMVVGPVGCGKSSLLYALLGEMVKHTGTVTWKRDISIAYCSQKAWIMNASLRDNILFGKDFDADVYNTIVRACALEPDIEMLPAGDSTEIGEKGINLSGGQKQRVSLARAMYSNADILLLDDPFSALDAHVGSHIFSHGIQNYLLTNKKTIILVTHQLHYLPDANKVLVMKDGVIILEGLYEDFLKTNPDVIKVIEEDHPNKKEHDAMKELDQNISTTSQIVEKSDDLMPLLSSTPRRMSFPAKPSHTHLHVKTKSHDHLPTSTVSLHTASSQDFRRRLSHPKYMDFHPTVGIARSSMVSLTSVGTDIDSPMTQMSHNTGNTKSLEAAEEGKLIEDEDRTTGRLSCKIFLQYVKAATWCLVVGTILGYFQQTLVIRMVKDIWLAKWSEASIQAERRLLKENIHNVSVNDAYDLHYHLNVFLGLSFTGMCLQYFQFIVLEFMALNASRNLHKKMVKTVIKAPMRFFDITPIGRIINRMSGDTNILDEKVAVTVDGLLFSFMYIFGGILLNCFSTPVFIIPAVLMFAVFIAVQRFYVASSRELQRLDSISKSPILAHFSETLGGLTTLRAYGHQKRFQCKSWKQVDVNNTAFNLFHAANAWMGIRLDMIGAFVVFSSAICCITSGLLGHIEASFVGIGITYALSFRSFMTWFMKCIGEFEIFLNAADRINYYNNIKPEVDCLTGNIPDKWPSEGNIKFEKTSLRYDVTLPKVIKQVDIHLKSRKKTGICGRTGSGKSSLTLGIFNMIDLCAGSIFIDDIDIKKIPLHDLRSRLAIIPQDPVLYYGTVRYNLDPEDKHSESEIWTSLEIAQLSPLIKSMSEKLDALVSEGGENFSVGQRQLFCLARAFLRNAKILVMDEPTASVDMKTDAIIQEVTNTVFQDKTIVTIAHRVATIVNYDWIIVLDKGTVLEEGPPQELISKGGSFAEMVKKNQ